jgi:hypothetical protein
MEKRRLRMHIEARWPTCHGFVDRPNRGVESRDTERRRFGCSRFGASRLPLLGGHRIKFLSFRGRNSRFGNSILSPPGEAAVKSGR